MVSVNSLLVSGMILGAAVLCVAAEQPVQDKIITMETSCSVYNPENYDLKAHYSIGNAVNNYVITILQSKNIDKQPPRLTISVSEPSGAVGRHGMPFLITVNGISFQQLCINKDKIAKWEDSSSGSAGYDIPLNFDGVKVTLRYFMRPDSPLLWCKIIHTADSVEPLNSAELRLHACVQLGDDAKTRWSFEPYAREIVTPKRIITEQSDKPVTLDPAENWIIVRDTKFDGSDPKKGNGPGYFVFEPAKTTKMSVVNDVYHAGILTLTPDFKEFTVGFWKTKKRMTNAEFDEFFKENQVSFAIK